MTQKDGDRWLPLAAPDQAFRFCANAAHDACNWMVQADGFDSFCRACRLNRTIPNLDMPGQLPCWQRLEGAKHRLVYGLLRFGLPLTSKDENPRAGVAFDFLAGLGSTLREIAQAITGHSQSLITIGIAEANGAQREHHRRDMAELYRTLIGHFRHEIGHCYWERLVRNGPCVQTSRALLSDDRQDYGISLEEH